VLILLPPSEGKSEPRRGKRLDLAHLDFSGLITAREEMLAALVGLCSTDDLAAAATLGLGTTQIDQVALNAGLRSAPTSRADRIYTGVLYDALGLTGLDATSRSRATRWLAITSSLFGLVRPSDPIPAYRLSGDVTLPGLGGVGAHWRRHLDPVVREAMGAGLLIDLRSTTYAAFWRPAPDLASRVATLRVLHQVGDQRKVVSHFNKATKGRIVRDLLVSGVRPRSPKALADHLTELGWTVESQAPGKNGQQLDVIVSEL